MDNLTKRTLGRTGLEVTQLGFGAAKRLRTNIDQSLRRLKTDCVDLLQMRGRGRVGRADRSA